MKWTVTTPPAVEPLTWSEAEAQARIDSNDEQTWGEQAIRTVRSNAETEAGICLITQTITAIVHTAAELRSIYNMAAVQLPRGPATAITSIKDANNVTVPAEHYALHRYGLHDFVELKKSPTFPITIVYTAGYGDTAAAIPPILKGMMLAHFTFLFENRSADVEPAALDRIYRRYRSFVG